MRTGFFADEVVAARHRLAGIALATGGPLRAVRRLSRRNARVWGITGAGGPRVVKLACGGTVEQTRTAATWLAREVAVLRALHERELLPYRVVDFGAERDVARPTWMALEHVPGCRASLLLRNACHGETEVLDLCRRIVALLARQHRADLAVLDELGPVDQSVLDIPVYGGGNEAAALVQRLSALREAAPSLVLCHGDLSLHNVLVSADEVRFVDWANARADVPSLDLAPVFVWLAHHSPAPEATAGLLEAVRVAYRGARADPETGLPEHLARVLWQWAAWRGQAYADAAMKVADAGAADAAVAVLTDAVDGIRRLSGERTSG